MEDTTRDVHLLAVQANEVKAHSNPLKHDADLHLLVRFCCLGLADWLSKYATHWPVNVVLHLRFVVFAICPHLYGDLKHRYCMLTILSKVTACITDAMSIFVLL